MKKLKLYLWSALFGVIVGGSPVYAEKVTITLPPDPNALPVFVLKAKQAEFLPQDEIVIVQAPGGDPSAMRAMIQGKKMDFAFFNTVGGANFVRNGMKQLKLVGPWVFKGVYLLTPLESKDLSALNGGKALIAPALSTPPHIIVRKALMNKGIQPKFLAGGSGAALFSQIFDKSKAPAGVAAAEPLISMILVKQKTDKWPQQWHIALDPTEALKGGYIPLGALWQVHAGVSEGVRKRFMEALDKAAAYTVDPSHRSEVAAIGSKGFIESFKNPVPREVFESLLENRRIMWKLDRGEQAQKLVLDYLKDVFNINVASSMFIE